jgi:hypothetical protein
MVNKKRAIKALHSKDAPQFIAGVAWMGLIMMYDVKIIKRK